MNSPRVPGGALMPGHKGAIGIMNNQRNKFHSLNTANKTTSESSVRNNAANRLPPLECPRNVNASSGKLETADGLYQSGLLALNAKDEARALEFFQKAAEQDHIDATYQYAHLLAKDPTHIMSSARIMRKAAQQKHKDAMYEYGQIVESGKAGAYDRDEVLKYYRLAAQKGSGQAMYAAGMLQLKMGRISDETFSLFQSAAKRNIPGALLEVARCYQNGTGVQQNVQEAVKIYRQLAEQNDSEGILELAKCMKNGICMEKDVNGSISLLNRAMALGNPNAKLYYARLLDNGDGVQSDAATAQQIYLELAQNGNPLAQYNLGSFFQHKKNYEEAIKYYSMAIAQNHVLSMFALGSLQLSSQDPQMRKEGEKNLKKAADAGEPRAQYNYALQLDKSSKDKTLAYKYYKMASDQGIPNAMCNYASVIFKTDPKGAQDLFKQAADKGHAISQYRYSMILKQQNDPDYLRYLQSAAENKYPKALYSYGVELGEPGVKLIKESADKGYVKAQLHYSQMNKETDPDLSERYLNMALKSTDPMHLLKSGTTKDDPELAKLAFQLIKDDNQAKMIYGKFLLPIDSATAIRLLSESAKSGNAEAKYIYGTVLEKGEYTKQNLLEAKKNYQEAIRLDHSMAMCRYGKLMKVEDPPTSRELFLKASSLGNLFGHYLFGRMLEIGGKIKECMEYYKKAADEGNIAKAQFRYARVIDLFLKDDYNITEAVEYYQRAANQKYPKAQNNLARCYESGLGVPVDKEKAAMLYIEAAEAGNEIAKHNHARILEFGIGVPQNENAAAMIYKKLAEKPDGGLAQYHYARMLHNGIGVDEDYYEAKRLYLMAIENNIMEAKQNYGVLLVTKFQQWNNAARYFEMAVSGNQGLPSAKYNYGMILSQGMGVPQDNDLAEVYFYESAVAGFIPGMYSYAQLLSSKSGEENRGKMIEWYERVANASDPKNQFLKTIRNAQYELATFYKDGIGCEKNEVLYKKYIKMAADNQHPDAEYLVNPPSFELKLDL